MSFKKVVLIFCLAAFVMALLVASKQNDSSGNKIEWGYLEKPQLTFGVIPYDSDEAIKKGLEPLLKYLEENLNRQVVLNISSDFTSLETLLELGRIDIAWISQTAFERSRFNNHWEIVCRPVCFNKDYHFSIFVVQKTSSINSLEDLKGRRIAYIDRLSDSGFSAAARYLRKNGIDPIQDFSQTIFTGLNSRSLEMLLNNEVGVAALFANPPEAASETTFLPDTLKVLAWSDPVKNNPIIIRKDLENEFGKNIKELFLKMSETKAGQETISNLTALKGLEKFQN